MPDAELLSSGPDRFDAIAVIVLYKLRPSESVAFRSLNIAMEGLNQTASKFHVLIFDNTPENQNPGPLPANFQYFATGHNAGLAPAYNRALSTAFTEGFVWLLTLDQDTSLPPDYLVKMRTLALHWQQHESVAAIVPQMRSGSEVISPLYVHLLRNSPTPKGFMGLNVGELYALNSAALLRVNALREIGGFCEEFWLDQLDLVLHHQLHRARKRIYIASDIYVQHELSLQDYPSLSTGRFRNFLQSESAFFDIYKGVIENHVLTARLLFRYFKHKSKGTNPAIVREIFEVLKQRIFHSKSSRISQWRQSARMRAIHTETSEGDAKQAAMRPRISVCMAAYDGEKHIVAQLMSILSQLSSQDELIVVDDASSDGTVSAVRSLKDSRIRLIEHERNTGILLTFEDAVRAACGEVIFLSDQDDLWMPNKIATVLRALQLYPAADIVVSDARLVDESGASTDPSYYAQRGKFRSGVLANVIRCSYLGCTMAFRRRICAKILPFPRGADVLHDLWIGTLNSLTGGKTQYIDEPLVCYRRHERNATGNSKLSLARQIRIRWDLLRSLAAFLIKRDGADGSIGSR